MQRIDNDWEFVPQFTEDFMKGAGKAEAVRIPHTVKEVPLHYIDSESYQMISGYRKRIPIPADLGDKRVFLQFDGAAHIATVYCDGTEVMSHRCGYTAFRAEITDYVKPGEEALIAVKLDSTENPAVPPFGFVIDYLTFGGIYRDVWLDIRPKKVIDNLFVFTPTLTTAKVSCKANLGEHDALRFDIIDDAGLVLGSYIAAPGQTRVSLEIPSARPWCPDDPVLYTCRVTLMENAAIDHAKATEGDSIETTFGFRTATFKADGFYLNGEKVFLRGLNRHQSYPYVGYAVPEQLQRDDVRILQEELACNAVRTSHYPQSHYFIDECDRRGMLVFTELPGWQHIGDEAWKDQACVNVREMIMEYRNHPSIILWGVRINESLDDDDFYTRTNAIAHTLDPSRATTGVRYFEKSHLLEDVYAFNDFSHNGTNPGCKSKHDVTPDMKKALLISESNGHMFPTKSFDIQERRQEHALRHARVLDKAMADGGHVGCFQWCMFDYPTHRQFGSGDYICYHGVLDSFRNPKLAAAVYASQGDDKPVLEVGSSMDIGDYDGGQIGDVYVFTNADEVVLYKNDQMVTKLSPGPWKALPHGPLKMDDTIGELVAANEDFAPDKAKAVHDILLDLQKYGINSLPVPVKMKMGMLMARYKLSYDDGVALYGKYVGNWGGDSTVWRFDALVDGHVVASVTKCPTQKLHLEVTCSHTDLHEGEVYDLAGVRVRLLDENGSVASYAQIPISFAVEGEAELVGPATATAEGGMTGTFVRTTGEKGVAKLTVSSPQTDSVVVNFTIA